MRISDWSSDVCSSDLHTPRGSELALATGEAFDVKVKTTVQSRERLSSSKWRTSMRYEISNAKTQPISVDLTQAGLDFALNDTRIIEESQKSQRIRSDAARWTVQIGRASCRERVCQYVSISVDAVSLKKKTKSHTLYKQNSKE